MNAAPVAVACRSPRCPLSRFPRCSMGRSLGCCLGNMLGMSRRGPKQYQGRPGDLLGCRMGTIPGRPLGHSLSRSPCCPLSRCQGGPLGCSLGCSVGMSLGGADAAPSARHAPPLPARLARKHLFRFVRCMCGSFSCTPYTPSWRRVMVDWLVIGSVRSLKIIIRFFFGSVFKILIRFFFSVRSLKF